MKNLIVVLALLLGASQAFAGDTAQLYHPAANAARELDSVIAVARQQKKHVLVQAGGNWCVWCLRFNKFTTEDAQLDSAIKANYVVYHLNFSKENKNEAVFEKLGFPQRFGFPVFLVLDSKGNRLHTQNSAYLEEGKGYSKNKILEFLQGWTPKALLPATYRKG
jgi:thiol:disulfide interchange protein